MALDLNERFQFGLGASERVLAILDLLGARTVFLVTGRTSYRRSGAAEALRAALEGRRVVAYDEVDPNPTSDAIDRAVAQFRRSACDVVLAVGGGSALDTGKLVAFLHAQDASSADVARNSAGRTASTVPVIAVPTTAGSGAEATHFAVLYVGGIKHSIGHPTMLPRYAVVDPCLTFTLPPRITAATGWDALSQAVEGVWSVHSTETSTELASRAIALLLPSLADVVRRPTPALRAAVAEGALLAGRAIDIARTTAPHAMSYPLTVHFGVPHGHAVALTLGSTLAFNADVRDDDSTDSRGPVHVRETLRSLTHALGGASPADASARLQELLGSCGLETRLSDLGIRTAGDRARILAEVDAERLGNNPRRMSRDDVASILDSVA